MQRRTWADVVRRVNNDVGEKKEPTQHNSRNTRLWCPLVAECIVSLVDEEDWIALGITSKVFCTAVRDRLKKLAYSNDERRDLFFYYSEPKHGGRHRQILHLMQQGFVRTALLRLRASGLHRKSSSLESFSPFTNVLIDVLADQRRKKRFASQTKLIAFVERVTPVLFEVIALTGTTELCVLTTSKIHNDAFTLAVLRNRWQVKRYAFDMHIVFINVVTSCALETMLVLFRYANDCVPRQRRRHHHHHHRDGRCCEAHDHQPDDVEEQTLRGYFQSSHPRAQLLLRKASQNRDHRVFQWLWNASALIDRDRFMHFSHAFHDAISGECDNAHMWVSCLFHAIERNNVELLRFLLDLYLRCMSEIGKDEDFVQLFKAACRAGSLECLQEVYAKCPQALDHLRLERDDDLAVLEAWFNAHLNIVSWLCDRWGIDGSDPARLYVEIFNVKVDVDDDDIISIFLDSRSIEPGVDALKKIQWFTQRCGGGGGNGIGHLQKFSVTLFSYACRIRSIPLATWLRDTYKIDVATTFSALTLRDVITSWPEFNESDARFLTKNLEFSRALGIDDDAIVQAKNMRFPPRQCHYRRTIIF
jgi:hypothetical protein